MFHICGRWITAFSKLEFVDLLERKKNGVSGPICIFCLQMLLSKHNFFLIEINILSAIIICLNFSLSWYESNEMIACGRMVRLGDRKKMPPIKTFMTWINLKYHYSIDSMISLQFCHETRMMHKLPKCIIYRIELCK